MSLSKYAFVKAVDEPLSGNTDGAVFLCPYVPEGGIIFIMEEKT